MAGSNYLSDNIVVTFWNYITTSYEFQLRYTILDFQNSQKIDIHEILVAHIHYKAFISKDSLIIKCGMTFLWGQGLPTSCWIKSTYQKAGGPSSWLFSGHVWLVLWYLGPWRLIWSDLALQWVATQNSHNAGKLPNPTLVESTGTIFIMTV
jgi:hypothetical protein